MSRPVIGITTSCGPDPKETKPNERFYVNRLYADRLRELRVQPSLQESGNRFLLRVAFHEKDELHASASNSPD